VRAIRERVHVARGTRTKLELIFGLLLVPWVALVSGALVSGLPPALQADRAPSVSVRVLDRHGVLLREVRAADGSRARWVRIDELGENIERAILAAEDQRFYGHPGVDPLAILRAFGQALIERRVVSGASTLTQQLARTLVKRPRTLGGKFVEAALALRIEGSLTKREILEQYLNRVSFGPSLRGVEAASRYYFDKPTRALSLAEAAALASIPRGPSLYDPRRPKGLERLRRRRDRVLSRMEARGAATAEQVERAKAEPLVIARFLGNFGAPHFTQAVLSGALAAGLPPGAKPTELTTTVDRELYAEIEALARSTVRALAGRHVTAAAVVVLDNPTGEVLAYVGAPDLRDEAHFGHNDGVLARRQPGSALKPFVYSLAMERLGFTASTVLPDVALHFTTTDGDYHPNNYDGLFHGPVRLREALGNSYNVPAVWTASLLGPERLLHRLRELGFPLTDSAATYGAGLALGGGEVRLIELANAYATLARGGVLLPVRPLREATTGDGSPIDLIRSPPRRVIDERAAFVVTHILKDKGARSAAFGEGGVLEMPFETAVKTGTSKGYRDNVTVGYTPDLTVAVWVGNFDGSPMQGVSGVSGAGPLFRAAMLAAARLRPPRAFDRPDGLAEAEVCSLSGARPTSLCPHRRRELFLAGSIPSAVCTMHEEVRVDSRSGLRAGPGCEDSVVETRVFEAFPAPFGQWARDARRALAPEQYSASCPGSASSSPRTRRPRVAFPPDGAHFVIDPALGSQQSVRLRVDLPSRARRATLTIDGRTINLGSSLDVDWPLARGEHRVRAEADGEVSDWVEFAVD
jgi:penicillin-binding protein 1C